MCYLKENRDGFYSHSQDTDKYLNNWPFLGKWKIKKSTAEVDNIGFSHFLLFANFDKLMKCQS